MKTQSTSRGLQPLKWSAIVLVLAILLAACQPVATPSPAPTVEPTAVTIPTQPVAPEPPSATEVPPPSIDLSAQLVGPLWLLIGYGDALNPNVVEPGTSVTLQFSADKSIGGFGGCNNFFGPYELNGEEIKIGPLGSTMMACEKGMNQEAVVLAALNSAYRISITPQDRLEVFYDSASVFEKKLVFTQSQKSLLDTLWLLEEFGDISKPSSIENGTFITAQFAEEGLLSGYSGCNRYTTSFKAENGRMEIGMPASTMMACDKGMEQEAIFQQALEKAESYTIKGDSLEITYNAGKGLLRFTSRHLPIENVLWSLVSMNGETNIKGIASTTILFEPGVEPNKGIMGGVAMCNNYSGGYTTDQGALSIKVINTTRVGCPDDVIQAEASYMEILDSTQSYQVLGQTLTITAEKGVLVFAANRAPLEGTYWRLVSMGPIESPTIPGQGADFTAQFVPQEGGPSGLVIGSTGCNDYHAPYVANLNELKVNLPIKTNNSGCAPDFWELEQQFFLGMNNATSYRILGDTLQIPYDEGRQMLTFIASVPEVEPSGNLLTPLNGTRWWLVSIGPRAVISGSQVTAEFTINSDGETGRISGNAGCNTYSADITGVLRVNKAMSTMSFCPEPAGLMDQELAYLAALATANSFAKTNNQLLIGTQNGLLVFYNSPVPLQPGPTPTQPEPGPATPTAIAPTAEPTAKPTEEPTAKPTEKPTAEPTVAPPATEEPTKVAPEAPPVAVIKAPLEGSANQPVQFDAGSSTSAAKITSYSWDFGDGAKDYGVTVKHQYAKPGTYTVILTISDSNGKTATATHTITIK